jgi:RimJ/RimL family protein N-acetyltransferase
MPGPVFLHGDAVELRTIEPEDTSFVQELVSDPAVWQSLAAVGPRNHSTHQEWIETRDEDDGAYFLVCVDGEPVGSISLKPPNPAWGTAEIGFMIAPAEWGNGYATRAVELVCDYAFEHRRLDKLYATVFESNPASARVLEKAGFTKEGQHRKEAFTSGERVDIYRYGLLVEEWSPEE